jgi:Ca2+-binding RTX toxin-like protein
MKKAILISLAIFACLASPASAGQTPYNVLLAGGAEANRIYIWLSADGREYVIDSIATLEVGGGVCVNPPGMTNRLVCQAPRVRSFMVNASGGDDVIVADKRVPIPVILIGGPGNDELIGGGGNDRFCLESSPASTSKQCGLVGGPGDDRIVGRGGDDWLLGGLGNDELFGGPGDDLLIGGARFDEIKGGGGEDRITQ